MHRDLVLNVFAALNPFTCCPLMAPLATAVRKLRNSEHIHPDLQRGRASVHPNLPLRIRRPQSWFAGFYVRRAHGVHNARWSDALAIHF